MKCITFDKQAQDNLPQHILDKMKKNQEDAKKEINSKEIHKHKK